MKSITVASPSRLHFSLIDLNGELGRIDGGIGVALNRPSMKVEVSIAEDGKEDIPEEAIEAVNRIKSRMNLRNRYKVRILSRLPAHVGLEIDNTVVSLCRNGHRHARMAQFELERGCKEAQRERTR